MIREEIPVEFFIEGGRSRTGKLLHPKLGMLRMVVNSAVHMKSDRILTIFTIAFSYEQIAEESPIRVVWQVETKGKCVRCTKAGKSSNKK